jgi:hypothetical protein
MTSEVEARVSNTFLKLAPAGEGKLHDVKLNLCWYGFNDDCDHKDGCKYEDHLTLSQLVAIKMIAEYESLDPAAKMIALQQVKTDEKLDKALIINMHKYTYGTKLCSVFREAGDNGDPAGKGRGHCDRRNCFHVHLRGPDAEELMGK